MKRIVSLVLSLCIMLSCVHITPVSAVAPVYTCSTAYKNSTYYQRLTNVNLSGNQRTDIINVAKSQVGYREGNCDADLSGWNDGSHSYNNYCEYNYWYYGGTHNGGSDYPWCATFVSWCARQANIPTTILKNSSRAGCSSSNFNISYYSGSSYTPQPGDLFFTSSWSHVGIVESVSGNSFTTIEGNTNNNGSSNGDGVYNRTRYGLSNYYFGVPNYSTGAVTPPDTEAPVINNLSVSNVSENSFTINCEVYDNIGVTSAYIIPYGPGGNSGNGFTIPVSNSFTHTINTADYGGEGLYSVHVYVYDMAGNKTSSALSDIHAISDSESPVMCKMYASNISSNSFTINCEVYDNIAVTSAYIIVYGPGGNSGNGFSIPVFNNFSYTVNTADYGGRGNYSVHVYIYDKKGNFTCAALNDINAVTDSENPVICAVRPSGISSKSFTINCDVYDNIAVTRAYIIVYGPGGNSGNGFSIPVFNNFSYTINTSDYGGEGWYSVHIYIFDDDGNQTGGGIENLHIADDLTKPQINNLTVSNISDTSFTINCSASEKIVRAWLNVYGPNYSDGYPITMYGADFMHTIDTSKYGGAGAYEVHVYVWDTAGNESSGRSTGTFVANKRYTVNFNANQGTTPISSMIVTNSTTYGSLPTPSRTGYTFAGWYTSASSGTQITNSSVVWLSSAQTLYAHWNPNSYTAYLDATGGNIDKHSISITYDSTYYALPTPTRKGYIFIGWYTAQDGGSLVTNDSKVTTTSNQTLYARWEKLIPYITASVSKKGSDCFVNVIPVNIEDPCEIIIAGYNAGKLVTLTSTPYTGEEINTTLTGDIDEIKVMVWDSLAGMKPLCEAEVIPESEFIVE
ncbi:MAG: CHAP domain-containing protein [Ruminococcaceae bacterium]|nr:CHAP domain-containing protein [Oscillospiraceae bacterium]